MKRQWQSQQHQRRKGMAAWRRRGNGKYHHMRMWRIINDVIANGKHQRQQRNGENEKSEMTAIMAAISERKA